MALYCRSIKADEKLKLEELAKGSDEELARRAQIVLLSAQRTGVHEAARARRGMGGQSGGLLTAPGGCGKARPLLIPALD
jgi:hypothetical protein